MRARVVVLALLLAACQPQSRRLLLLDLTFVDPVLLESTARPWHDVGYTVDYRRFYPHLTRQDLDAYRVLLLLGGRRPEEASDALTAGDVALLDEWTRRGGVVVFGYAGDGEGYFDRWVMNRWLAAAGVGITIGDYVVRDTIEPTAAGFEPQPRVTPLRRSPLRDLAVAPFPAGRNHVLLVTEARHTLARSTATAFVQPPGQPAAARPEAAVAAASRVGQGLVVIASRHALAALGPELRPATAPFAPTDELDRTRAFLVALARWTLRPAEWASVPGAGPPAPLKIEGGPLPVAPRPPPLAPPPAVRVEPLPADLPRAPAGQPPSAPDGSKPGWNARQGLRLQWADLPSHRGFQPALARARELDSLVALLEIGSFNAVALVARVPQALADSLRFPAWERDAARRMTQQVADRLAVTSLHWFPVIAFGELRLPPDTLPPPHVRSDPIAERCLLDPRLWSGGLAPAVRALARLGTSGSDLVAGIALDLDGVRGRGRESGSPPAGEFCDANYRAGLAALRLDSPRAERLGAVPHAARLDSLLVGGLLEAYYDALERLTAERAAAVRADARRLVPGLLFAIHASAFPADWYSLGLMRGFSGEKTSGGPPVLLWSHEVRTHDALRRYRERGILALHATGFSPRYITPPMWPRLRRAAFVENDGFWLADAERVLQGQVDSLGRLIRRLAKD